MGGDSRRKLKPRQRNNRPLNGVRITEDGPKTPLPTPIEKDGFWTVDGGLASRLYQKSAIGKQLGSGTLGLSGPEVMFCHWHRHLPLPSDNWVEEQMANNPQFMHECAAFEAVRDGGEKVVMVSSLSAKYTDECVSGTWAMRWKRDQHPNKNEPLSQVRWFPSQDCVDWRELYEWVESVHAHNHKADILVVDGEFDVTVYRLTMAKLEGSMSLPNFSDFAKSKLEALWKNRVVAENGVFIALNEEEWFFPTVGVSQMGGIWLDSVESDWIESRIFNSEISGVVGLYANLIERGLLCRPGFKYGCRWRIYAESMDEAHAPWLLSPEFEAPKNWDGACLAVRLSAGVHKTWVCALDIDGWNYISLERKLVGRD